MVDIVAYMTVVEDRENPEKSKRVLICDSESDRYTAKDRTGTLDRYEKPDWNSLLEKINKSDFWAEDTEEDAPDESESDESDLSQDESLEDVENEMTADDTDESEGADIALLELNAGAEKALKAAGITTVEKLMDHTKTDLQKIKGIGDATVDEVVSILDEVGKSLKDEMSDEEEKKVSTLTDRLKGQN